ncbi:hypothetical protein HHK36_024996 [Tetracentron sinense]|uniref:Thioredoxin-like fold domain-containing protein n=2 Tax=Magnoliopsida TaxID=3398 RepID=A0A834YLW1_TETSI|nr:hypothetical protein HHK36_024996 [Tetracentron sinense]
MLSWNFRYYTGYPKDLGPSRVIHFTSEREFVQLLHEDHSVVVAFTIRSNYTKHFDKVLEEAAVEFYPHVKFMRVECPKYPGFCITRQRKDYPFIEIFHSPEQVGLPLLYVDLIHSGLIGIAPKQSLIDCLRWLMIYFQPVEDGKVAALCHAVIYHFLEKAANQGKIADPNITKYSVKVLPFNYDISVYGFREFFKRHGIWSSDKK